MPKIEIIPVHSINELSILLSENDCRIIAGGIAIRDEMGTVDSKIRKLIDISPLHEQLSFIRFKGNRIEIGALTSVEEIFVSPILQTFSPALIRAIASWESRASCSQATIGGSLAYRSLSDASIPVMIIHNAKIRIKTINDFHEIEMDHFLSQSPKYRLKEDEFIFSVSFRKPQGFWGSSWSSIVDERDNSSIQAAAMISLDEEQKISAARIAVQQKGRMVFRARAVEKFIIENHVDELQIENAVSNVKKDIPSSAVNPPLNIMESVLKTVLADSLKQANTFQKNYDM
jgi:CO/xanthine dehydrogenase FAD-binding subunit